MLDALQKILMIENEQKRRNESALSRYNKDAVHVKQMEFHKCLKRNRWVFGGNRTGKTECGAVETVWLARGIHPYRANKPDATCWVVSLSQAVQRDVAQKKLLRYIDTKWIKDVTMLSGSKDSPSYGVIDKIILKNVFGGESSIGFKSCEAGREKFQGASLDFVWFDEQPPKDIYDECRMRVLDRAGHIFATMTPLKGLDWVYEEIYLNKACSQEVWCEFIEWADNPYLSQKEIEALSETMSAEFLNSRRYGHFQSVGGLVYPEFDERLHVIEPFDVPKEWQDCLSVDPGLNNPLSCHWYAVDYDGNIFVTAEHYEAKKDIAYHSEKIKAICRSLDWKTGRFGAIDALIDSAANQRTLSASKTVAELFYEQGINVNTRVNKDMFTGINRVKSFLKPLSGKPKLYVFKTCVNLIREFKGYFWGSGERPVKADDHALDELRYYVCSKPQPSVASVKQISRLSMDKEKLCRKRGKRGPP